MPWDDARRAAVKNKIDKEAARAVARLGARTVAVICFFDEAPGGHLIMLEGGTAPFPAGQLYAQLASIYAANEAKQKAAAGLGPVPPKPPTQN